MRLPEAFRRIPFYGRRGKGRCLSTRQYARLLSDWIASIGLDPALFGTHSLRRTKATSIHRRTGSLLGRVELLLGHTKVDSSQIGIEVDDALAIAEQIDLERHEGKAGHALPATNRARLARS